MRACTILLASLLAGAQSTARADEGVYFSQSLGVAHARGGLADTVGNAIETRLALGARIRWLAVEGWVMSNVQTDRDGGRLAGFVGGDPADGRADLEAYGFALRAITPLYRAPGGERIEGYLRLSPGVVAGTDMLEGYRGMGFGASGGIVLTGKVRALGFLWAPFLFMKKGPKITGSLFIDQGFDFVRMERTDARTIRARVGHISLGFALGSTF
jgi:hypothetical protein